MLDAATAVIAVLDAATAVIAVLDAMTAAIAVLDAATAVMAVLDATTAVIAVLDAITAAIAVLDAATAVIAVLEAATAAIAVLEAATAAIAVLEAATAVIAVLEAATRRACPRMPSNTFNSASLPGSAVNRVCSCAPVSVPASTALSIRIALTIGMMCPYDLITVMGHAVRMAGLVVASAPLALVSMTVTVLAALTKAW